MKLNTKMTENVHSLRQIRLRSVIDRGIYRLFWGNNQKSARHLAMKLNTKMTENLHSLRQIRLRSVIDRGIYRLFWGNNQKSARHSTQSLLKVMASVLTRIHWFFAWQLHYFLSIVFPILSPSFMKHGTYIASHKTNLLEYQIYWIDVIILL